MKEQAANLPSTVPSTQPQMGADSEFVSVFEGSEAETQDMATCTKCGTARYFGLKLAWKG